MEVMSRTAEESRKFPLAGAFDGNESDVGVRGIQARDGFDGRSHQTGRAQGSYLAAERVDRIFDEVTWTPASTSALCCGSLASDPEALGEYRLSAEKRALELRLPLIWPERFPDEVPAAMRAAHYASEQGRGAPFVLAAGRLAFCGGFDLDDPELLAEAAAAAGIDMQGWLHALGEVRRDGEIEAAGRSLLAAGAERLPALRVGDALFCGEHRIDEAAAAARHLAARAAGATG
jgi:2-hydroxychromene-2-carboxylate isomerase